jgi:hypothetical protein
MDFSAKKYGVSVSFLSQNSIFSKPKANILDFEPKFENFLNP